MAYEEFEVEVPESVHSAAKAVVASLTSLAGVAALFVTAVADGSVSGAEGGTLLTAVLTGVATVVGVWAKRNQRQS